MHIWCFQAVLALMSDSLTTTQVEPHQCPSHLSILLILDPISEIFAKERPFWTYFFKNKFFLLHFYENPSKVLEYQGWYKILMITLLSSQKSPTPNLSAHSVHDGENFSNMYVHFVIRFDAFDATNVYSIFILTRIKCVKMR